MSQITPTTIAELRRKSNAGMMDCKKALIESNGDMDVAFDILRKKGIASSEARNHKDANEGVIEIISYGVQRAAMVEINCETDFVARNESFLDFAEEVACNVLENLPSDEQIKIKSSEFGEKISLGRSVVYDVSGTSYVQKYVHTGQKMGVLIEIDPGSVEFFNKSDFISLVNNILLQIAATNPASISKDDLDPKIVEKERSIYAGSDRLKGKPAAMVDKILDGMLSKFYGTVCLLDQPFIKDGSKTIRNIISEVSPDIKIKRFARFEIGK